MLLVAAEGTARRLLENTPVSRFVPVYTSVGAVVRGAATEPQRRLAKITLPRLADTPRRARNFTRQVCERWMPGNGVAGDAVLVANELVENALAHTLSEPSLRLELRRKQFSVAVGDLSPVPAQLREGSSRSDGGLVCWWSRNWRRHGEAHRRCPAERSCGRS